MQLKDKILNILDITKKHFLMPFCLSVFTVLIIIFASGLRFNFANTPYFLYIGLFFGFSAFFLRFKQLDERGRKINIIIAFFLGLLIACLIVLLIDQILGLKNIKEYQGLAWEFIIFSGFLIFWRYKDKIKNILEEDRVVEDKIENQRAKEFPNKFFKINKVPIAGSVLKYFYKLGWIYVLSLFILISSFLIVQWIQLHNTGIGTDEGNFLYTVKLLLQEKKLFIDFWSRESGSLIFLIPWFKIFSVSIINLRLFIFLTHIIFLYVTICIINCFSPNKTQRLMAITLITVIYLTKVLNFYAASFYQIFNLLTLITVLLLIKIFINGRVSYLKLIILGLITGINCLVYRGGVGIYALTLATLLITFFLKNWIWGKIFIKKIALYIAFTSLPIIIYWFYYAIHTSYYHIYKVIIGGYFEEILPIGAFIIIIFILIKKIEMLKRLAGNFDFHILMYNIFLYGMFLYSALKNESFFQFFYAGIFFDSIFILFSIQALSIYLSKSNKLKHVLFFLYSISGIFIFYKGYGFRGYYTGVNSTLYLLSIPIFIFYIFVLYQICKQKKDVEPSEKLKFFLIILVFINLIFIFGGELTSNRFQESLLLCPLMILGILLIRIKKAYWSIKLLIVGSLIFFTFTNLNLSQDYTFYSIKDLMVATAKINQITRGESTVFSADTSILSEIQSSNIISFHSPFHFREEKDLYFYDGIEKFNTDISITRSQFFEKMQTQEPDFIIGSWRSTMRLFDDPSWNAFLSKNYIQVNRVGRIYIYESIKHETINAE